MTGALGTITASPGGCPPDLTRAVQRRSSRARHAASGAHHQICAAAASSSGARALSPSTRQRVAAGAAVGGGGRLTHPPPGPLTSTTTSIPLDAQLSLRAKASPILALRLLELSSRAAAPEGATGVCPGRPSLFVSLWPRLAWSAPSPCLLRAFCHHSKCKPQKSICMSPMHRPQPAGLLTLSRAWVRASLHDLRDVAKLPDSLPRSLGMGLTRVGGIQETDALPLPRPAPPSA